ncbi:MAG: hypothetical protein FH749_14060 [Firmicutes bacterium]|nr:hypothetical protein [Bacillota bacterium]
MTIKKRWLIFVGITFGVIIIVAAALFWRPLELNTVLAREFEGEIATILISEHNPGVRHDYEISDSRQIDAVIEYLDDISLRRTIIRPEVFRAGLHEDYHLTLVNQDGEILRLWLIGDYVEVGFEKVYSAFEPEDFQALHAIIADFPRK